MGKAVSARFARSLIIYRSSAPLPTRKNPPRPIGRGGERYRLKAMLILSPAHPRFGGVGTAAWVGAARGSAPCRAAAPRRPSPVCPRGGRPDYHRARIVRSSAAVFAAVIPDIYMAVLADDGDNHFYIIASDNNDYRSRLPAACPPLARHLPAACPPLPNTHGSIL